MQAVCHVEIADFICRFFQAVVLPEIEQIDDLDLQILADAVERLGIPSVFQQRLFLAVAVSALLLDEDHAHTLCHCALGHIRDDLLILRLGGVVLGIGVVDADRNDIDIAGLTVLFDDIKLTCLHEAACVLAGCRHVHDLPFVTVHELREHLRPARLLRAVQRIVVADRGVAADPDRRICMCLRGNLLDLQRRHCVCIVRLAGAGADIELPVRDGNLKRVVGVVSGHVHDLEHSLNADAGAAGVAKPDRYLIETVRNIRAECVFALCGCIVELHGIAERILAGSSDILHICAGGEAVAAGGVVAVSGADTGIAGGSSAAAEVKFPVGVCSGSLPCRKLSRSGRKHGERSRCREKSAND